MQKHVQLVSENQFSCYQIMQVDVGGSIVANTKEVVPCYGEGSCGFMRIQATLNMENNATG